MAAKLTFPEDKTILVDGVPHGVAPEEECAKIGDKIIIVDAEEIQFGVPYEKGDILTVTEAKGNGDIDCGNYDFIVRDEYRVLRPKFAPKETPQDPTQDRLNALTEAKISDLYALAEQQASQIERMERRIADLEGETENLGRDFAALEENTETAEDSGYSELNGKIGHLEEHVEAVDEKAEMLTDDIVKLDDRTQVLTKGGGQ